MYYLKSFLSLPLYIVWYIAMFPFAIYCAYKENKNYYKKFIEDFKKSIQYINEIEKELQEDEYYIN